MKALVIGGTSAIGQGIINKLAENGYEVLFTYNSNEDKAKLVAEFNSELIKYCRLNLADSAAVTEFICTMKQDIGPNVLVNVAGITNDSLSFGDINENLTKVHTVNFLSPATIAAKAAEVMMEKRSGHIVNISSVAAKTPKTGNGAYGSAKTALERFTASLSVEVARFKVRTINIAPAFVNTPMFTQFANGKEREVIRTLPLREILEVDDVANAVLAFVTGNIKTTGVTLPLTNGAPVL
ncbi:MULTISPECIES: SDR family oxidoreductase [Pseudoalteromonas]|uniref:SDR family NAD(P)-dependent oxidoreductase n=1 Tax=Pseudoalteromonas TaxID=53246 RepID=UPI00029A6570|nr:MULTISPECIES: SDR family oxidoreductase [Pseudoalteromonas]MBR8845631.1 SDR family oxidoreductase [Pseudoalteromonas sp. JC3]NSY34799.1 SDR family NAD(P)-dependent oxidoreductase [Pseudoalteromonas sp. JC28]QUI72625.1 SDR family NAD(P)-dependent oxidoreductase [Pseudoalteromonas sp. M8]UDM60027.1 SDR family oxidoreductase [Pseudoalteromonas piscicida]WJE08840.1 SDR family oxidoreductase [Pseudoalteromonas sp. JC3]